ncbi:MAG: ATP synthase F1 subunit gamma [Acetobacteraceae bacterium]|nr:ATP synthase F1 subunit gamma [Acetobacteraceae bacterium]
MAMLDIRRRIRAVTSIQQVTRAMELVAATKLRRAQDRVFAARPYALKLREVLSRLAQGRTGAPHPLLRPRPVQRRAVAFVTGDRGLCGSYNTNVIKRVQAELDALAAAGGPELALIPIGRRGREHFRRRGHDFLEEFLGLGEEPGFHQARGIARVLIRLYQEGRVDEVRFVFTEFVSALTQRPGELVLLPVAPPEGGRPSFLDYIYEPSPEAVLEALVPAYVEVQVFLILLESKASEHGARMTAMGNATDNAEEMIQDLTLEYNRERQASITKEISEIVRGAEALK